MNVNVTTESLYKKCETLQMWKLKFALTKTFKGQSEKNLCWKKRNNISNTILWWCAWQIWRVSYLFFCNVSLDLVCEGFFLCATFSFQVHSFYWFDMFLVFFKRFLNVEHVYLQNLPPLFLCIKVMFQTLTVVRETLSISMLTYPYTPSVLKSRQFVFSCSH